MLKPYACLALFCSLLLPSFAHADDSDVGCVTTEWKLLGANHKVCVSAFNDPDIPGVACYISQAKTGGVSGSLPKQANVFRESTSVFFKATRVTRIWDAKRNTLVYLAVSRRLVDGSPFNAISTVPVKQ